MRSQKKDPQFSMVSKSLSDTALSFLAPSSIAIIGASQDPGKRGYQALRLLLSDRFDGDLYPVNPKMDEILGVTCFPNMAVLPATPDLALICTPARTLPEMIRTCGEKGVGGCVVLAGGFSEAGPEGEEIERKMLDMARQYGVRLIGPNTSGCFNLHKNMNLAGIPLVKPGGLGLISQSGNMALSITTSAAGKGNLGFSTYVGVGNQVDISFAEYLGYLAADPHTEVATMYVEGFGDGRAFLEQARKVTPHKPVVLYKAGKTSLGQSSAKSHTGSLAGSYEMARDLLHQSGVIVARRSDHIVPIAEALSLCPIPNGNRVAILADGGGHATIAADTLVEEGVIEMAALSQSTRDRLEAILPAAASVSNPIDVAGGTDANTGVFADCVEILMEDEAVDAVLIGGLIGGYAMRFNPDMLHEEIKTSSRLTDLQARFAKPLVVQSLYEPMQPKPLQHLRAGGVPVQESIEIAVTCMAALVYYGKHCKRLSKAPGNRGQVKAPKAAQKILDKARAENRLSLFEHEALDLIRAYGIRSPDCTLMRSAEEAQAVSDSLDGRKLALKIVSRDILHKSEAKGVKLNISGTDAIKATFGEIIDNARAYKSDAKIEGVLAVPMAQPGVEVIIGCFRDPIYGPILMFGIGGTLVEVLRDVSFRASPATRPDIEEMLEELRMKALFEGVRGAAPIDREALIGLLLQVSDVMQSHPDIEEIDFNPVFAQPDGYTIGDARIVLRKD